MISEFFCNCDGIVIVGNFFLSFVILHVFSLGYP